MRKPSTILGNSDTRVLKVLRVLASTTVLLLSTSVWTWAQNADSGTSTASVDETFSVVYQALSATANDLLASAQRPLGVERPSSISIRTSAAGFSLNELQEDGQAAPRIRLQEAVERVRALRPVFEPILREEGIPQQMAAVVLIESGGRATALSPKGARGLWQFMPDTARRYGLAVTASVDDRLDPYKSTRSAARYLRDLYVQFGNWPLALAAYNAGEESVQRAVQRVSSRDFGSIAGMLPTETQNYVPAVLKAMDRLGAKQGRFATTSAESRAINSGVYAVAKLEN
jgi:soluble lytic murein transglycosylase-like protein